MRTSAELIDGVADAVPDVLFAFETDGQFLWWNRRLRAITGYTDAELQRMDPLDFVPDEDEMTVLSLIDRVVSEESTERVESRLVTKAGVAIPYEFAGGPLVLDGEVVGLAGVGRDVSGRERRRTALEQERTLHALGRTIDRELVEATTRAEVQRAVCESIAETSAYSGASFWARRGESGGFELQAAAGDIGSAAELLGVNGDGAGPASETIRSRTVVAVPVNGDEVEDGASARNGPEDAGATERAPGDETAAEDEATSVDPSSGRANGFAAVPIVTDERAFGVLGLTATCRWAFCERERELLAEMGARIADAIQAAVTRQLLYADAVTEVEVRTTDSAAAFVALSRETGGRFALQHAVGFEELVAYETVTGTSVDRVLEFVAADDRFDNAECLTSDGDRHTMEFRMAGREGTVTSIITRYGARTVAATAEGGAATVTVELPPDQDPREVIDAVRERFPATELVAIRESEQPRVIGGGVRRGIDEALTAKQRGSLEAAFAAGYFEWPARKRTAEEIAATLGIAPQTFHQHLRIAQRKLLEVVLDDVDGT